MCIIIIRACVWKATRQRIPVQYKTSDERIDVKNNSSITTASSVHVNFIYVYLYVYVYRYNHGSDEISRALRQRPGQLFYDNIISLFSRSYRSLYTVVTPSTLITCTQYTIKISLLCTRVVGYSQRYLAEPSSRALHSSIFPLDFAYPFLENPERHCAHPARAQRCIVVIIV